MNNSKGENVGKEWCREHITERNNWFVTQSGKKIEIQDDWKFCPVCGTPRPSEPKKLWEKLYDAYYSTTPECHRKFLHLAKEDHERVAQAAISHFLGVVESLPFHFYDFEDTDKIKRIHVISKSELMKKLKEEGEGL